MRGQVPLARRNLLADRRRLLASVAGVGLAVMLVLLLDGLWAGVQRQATAYAEHSGADLYVLQPGVRDLTAGVGTVPLAALDTVRATDGVAWAAPVRTAYAILELHHHKVPVVLAGVVPGQHGGPWAMAKGRLPRRDDEVVIGTLLARRHGIAVGDRIDVMGQSIHVVGLAGTNGYMGVSYVFATHHALEAVTATPGATTFIAVGTRTPGATAARLRAVTGLNVMTRQAVAANDLAFATGVFGSPIRLMVGIGLAAGTMIIALTAYTAVVERRREYGIVKAMGASRGRLVTIALTQTLTLAVLGLGAGVALFFAGRAMIADARPQFLVLFTSSAFTRAAVAAAVMALVAAVVPARRLAALEPASAYKAAS